VKRTSLTAIYAFVALVSFVFGFLSVQRAVATTYALELKVMGGATADMTCGWHGGCGSTPTAGTALDWDNYGNNAVYFRTFGHRDTGSESTMARGTVERAIGTTCATVYINIGSPAGGTYRGSIAYVHTLTSADGNSIDIVFSTGSYWTTSNFGTNVATADEENVNCRTPDLWDGAHVHQYAAWNYSAVSGGYRNTGTYPNYVNPGTYSIDTSTYWQDRAEWTVTQ